MNFTQICLLVCSCLFLVQGILRAQGVAFLTNGLRKKYTEESVQTFCKKNVWSDVIFAVGIGLEAFLPGGISSIIALVLCALGIVLTGMNMRKLEAK